MTWDTELGVRAYFQPNADFLLFEILNIIHLSAPIFSTIEPRPLKWNMKIDRDSR